MGYEGDIYTPLYPPNCERDTIVTKSNKQGITIKLFVRVRPPFLARLPILTLIVSA